ncbi:MAG: hypothetical protein ABFS56_28065 [Pseudomonadota bacterium]
MLYDLPTSVDKTTKILFWLTAAPIIQATVITSAPQERIETLRKMPNILFILFGHVSLLGGAMPFA